MMRKVDKIPNPMMPQSVKIELKKFVPIENKKLATSTTISSPRNIIHYITYNVK